jgi:hypothetical protein
MYSKVIDEAHSKGLKVESDNTLEEPAVRVYESLKKQGYDVQKNPKAREIDIGDGTKGLFAPTGQPVYTVGKRQKQDGAFKEMEIAHQDLESMIDSCPDDEEIIEDGGPGSGGAREGAGRPPGSGESTDDPLMAELTPEQVAVAREKFGTGPREKSMDPEVQANQREVAELSTRIKANTKGIKEHGEKVSKATSSLKSSMEREEKAVAEVKRIQKENPGSFHSMPEYEAAAKEYRSAQRARQKAVREGKKTLSESKAKLGSK